MVNPADVPDWGGGTQQGLYAVSASYKGTLTAGQVVHLIPALGGQTVYLFTGNAGSDRNLTPAAATLDQIVVGGTTYAMVAGQVGQVCYLYNGDFTFTSGTGTLVCQLWDTNSTAYRTVGGQQGTTVSWDLKGLALPVGAGFSMRAVQTGTSQRVEMNQSYLFVPSGDTPEGDKLSIQRTDGTVLQQLLLSKAHSVLLDFHGGKLPVGQGLDIKSLNGGVSGTITVNLVYLQG